MTKQELEERVHELEEMVASRDTALDYADEAYAELESNLSSVQDELDYVKDTALLDIENFKSRLTLDNLLTPELDKAIDEYMRYYNE